MSRARMKDKIAALRAKTRAAGCTEAVAAAELAAKLMAENGLSDAEMEMSEASMWDDTSRATWRASLSAVIAHCTNTAAIVLTRRDERGSEVLFTGRAPGPEIAVYLRDVCFRAVAREVRTFKGGTFYRRRRTVATRRQAVADFTGALVIRLSDRLHALFAPSIDEAAVREARNALQVRFKGSVAHRAPERKQRFSEAAGAGWMAGDDVALNHGVGAAERPTIALPKRGEG